MSLNLNSRHDFDLIFSDILYSKVDGSLYTYLNSKDNNFDSSRYLNSNNSIDNLIILHKINYLIDDEQYLKAVELIDYIIQKYQHDPLIANYFGIRKTILLMMNDEDENTNIIANSDLNDNHKSYLSDLSKDFFELNMF